MNINEIIYDDTILWKLRRYTELINYMEADIKSEAMLKCVQDIKKENKKVYDNILRSLENE